MARIRTIKPEFWTDYRMAEDLTRDQRLFYIGLWNDADDEGRFLAHPRRLLGAIFPYDRDLSESFIEDSFRVLVETGRLVLYEANGEPYGQLTKFTDHQRINRPSPSRIPPPAKSCEPSVNGHGAITEPSIPRARAPEQGAGSREQGKGAGKGGAAAPAARTESDAQRLTNLVIERGLNGVRPSDYGKQAAHAKQLLARQPFDYWAGAAEKMPDLFPYSDGEAWDVFDLGKKATKALASTRNGNGAHEEGSADEFWTDPDGYM